MDEEHKAAIMAASERATQADLRVTALGYMNTPQDYDARVKSRQEYDLAKAEAFAARQRLDALIYAPVSAAKEHLLPPQDDQANGKWFSAMINHG